MLFLCNLCSAVIQWFIFLIFQIFSAEGSKHLIRRCIFFRQPGEHGIQQGLCHIISIAVCRFHLAIDLFRVHAECHIGRQCPRCRGPCQEVSIFPFYFKTDNCGTFLDSLIPLCNLVGGQRRPAARAVRHNLKAFIQELFIPDLLQRPPFRLNKIIVIGDIRMFHIRPETDGIRELLPHTLVFPYGFLTLADKRIDTIILNLILSVDAECLLHFQFHGKSVGIPAGLSRNLISLHGTVTRNHILDDTGQDMADMRLAVCCRRSVIKSVGRSLFPAVDGFLKNIFFFPEINYLFLTIHKIKRSVYFLIHNLLPFCCFKKGPVL